LKTNIARIEAAAVCLGASAARKRRLMTKNHRGRLGGLLAAACVLGAASLVWTAYAKNSSQEPSPSPLLNKNEWQEGEACVKQNAPDCPSQYRGECRTARASGCDHKSCTAAKNQARADLRAAVPQECHKYIESTGRCKNGLGCRAAAEKPPAQK